MDSKEPQEKKRGARNLTILLLVSVFISLSLTTVSLAIYHYSGDIYLDRSRPGYLPDTEEILDDEEDEEGDYVFDKSGAITKEILDEYLEKLDVEVEALDDYRDPFDDEALSDAHFGL